MVNADASCRCFQGVNSRFNSSQRKIAMLKKNLLAVAVASAFALPGAVLAAEAASPHTITGNLSFVSDYSFRGLSQTLEEPAIQGGFDYAHSSGLYLGTWASNVSQSLYFPANMEWDFYGGWAKTFGDFGVNVGALLYYYPGGEPAPGEKYDTTEIYVGGSWKWISAKLSYAVSDFFGGNETTFPVTFSGGSDGSMYMELNATYPINDAFSITAHVGQQTVEGTAPGVDLDYTDYKIGVNYLWSGFNFGLAYKDTDAAEAYYTYINGTESVFIGDSAVILSVGKTF
jgi:uncharacterized protein (TIGR02001 family)